MSISRLNSLLNTTADWLRNPLLLIIRLFWGWQFAQTGWGKLMNLNRTAAFFGDLGIPLPLVNALAAGSVEFLGGLLLPLGLVARPAALALGFTMVVAYLTADREVVLAVFRAPDDFTSAAPFLFLFASLLVLAFGPGAWSVDAWRGRKKSAART